MFHIFNFSFSIKHLYQADQSLLPAHRKRFHVIRQPLSSKNYLQRWLFKKIKMKMLTAKYKYFALLVSVFFFIDSYSDNTEMFTAKEHTVVENDVKA